jgi:DNA-binding transcriptional regulator WhiA
MAARIHLSQDIIDIIKEKYISGLSANTIANELSYSTGFIRRTLKENNIQFRSLDVAGNRVKNINNIFENIDDECSAYYLGLFFADGNIKKSSNCCELKLIEQDRDILSKLSNIIFGMDRTIFINYKNYSYAGNANNLYTLKILKTP